MFLLSALALIALSFYQFGLYKSDFVASLTIFVSFVKAFMSCRSPLARRMHVCFFVGKGRNGDNTMDFFYCSDPLEGGGTIYSKGIILFREFSPIDILIVES